MNGDATEISVTLTWDEWITVAAALVKFAELDRSPAEAFTLIEKIRQAVTVS